MVKRPRRKPSICIPPGCNTPIDHVMNVRLDLHTGVVEHFLTAGGWTCGEMVKLGASFVRYCEPCGRKGGLIW